MGAGCTAVGLVAEAEVTALVLTAFGAAVFFTLVVFVPFTFGADCLVVLAVALAAVLVAAGLVATAGVIIRLAEPGVTALVHCQVPSSSLSAHAMPSLAAA